MKKILNFILFKLFGFKKASMVQPPPPPQPTTKIKANDGMVQPPPPPQPTK